MFMVMFMSVTERSHNIKTKWTILRNC